MATKARMAGLEARRRDQDRLERRARQREDRETQRQAQVLQENAQYDAALQRLRQRVREQIPLDVERDSRGRVTSVEALTRRYRLG